MKKINPEKNLFYKVAIFIIFFMLWLKIVNVFTNKVKNQNNSIKDYTKIEKKTETKRIGENIILENDYLKITLNTQGLILNDVLLKQYTKSLKDKDNIKLLEKDKYFITNDWLAIDNISSVPDKHTVWNFDKESYIKNKNKLIFNYKNEENIEFVIVFYLDDKYVLNIQQEIINNSANTISIKPAIEIHKENVVDKKNVGVFDGGIGYFSNKVEEIKPKSLVNSNIEFPKFNWAGFTNKYWITALINTHSGKINFLKKDNLLNMQFITNEDIEVINNSKVTLNFKLFLGAKERDILNEYESKENLLLFDRAIDYGFFHILTKPLSLLLQFINKIVKNFGFSIIIFTILIKMILYPITKKSSITVAKMKKIQPKLLELQKKYATDKMALQQQILKLYKDYDLNPAGGFLTMLIQIPLFIALYKVLNISLEMRQAPFIWFIKDLSANDPTNIFNLFGLLPFSTKFMLGILPCLMALSMFIQQKMNDKNQNDNNLSEEMKITTDMFKYMPLIFLFMFRNFPSGLLIYWILNNFITILQQLYIDKFVIPKIKNIR